MGRRAKPNKVKAEAKPALAGKSSKNESSRVRDLEKRLAEALQREQVLVEQQTATAEILSVISSSPTDVQPVFDTITQNALELCGAASSLLTTFDGELLHLAALANVRPGVADSLRRVYPMRPGRGAAGARAILTRAVVHIPDLREDPESPSSHHPSRHQLRVLSGDGGRTGWHQGRDPLPLDGVEW